MKKIMKMQNYEPDNFEDELERLKEENQMKRLKLRLEYGVDLPIESENQDIPPEIESQFLDSVAQFEIAHRKSERIPIYELIGRPDFRKTDTIPDAEILSELNHIIEVLYQNQIGVDTLCDVDNRVLYRFLTEELFFTETTNFRIDGMINHFIYEEFHPNHEYDIKNSCTWFIESFLDKGTYFYPSYLTEEAGKNPWYENFREAFYSFHLTDFKILTVQFDEQSAKVQYLINFSGIIDGTDEIEYFNGNGNMELIHQHDSWTIKKITIPFKLE